MYLSCQPIFVAVMQQDEIISSLMDMLVTKLRPVLYEIIKEVMPIPIQVPEKEDDELWNIKQVTKYFSCSRGKIFSHQRNGTIRSYRMGNRVYYKKKELLKSLKVRN
jgi:hypothetical protein